MIARHRLQGRGRFAAVRSHGVRASSGAIRVTVAANGLDVARVGFALPGLRSAVTRNRLRRRLREAIRPELVGLAGWDAIVSAGTDATVLDFAALHVELATALGHALARGGAPSRPPGDNGPMSARWPSR